jgi:hypothetical protein
LEYRDFITLGHWDRPSMTQVANKLRTLFFESQVKSLITDVTIDENELDFSQQTLDLFNLLNKQ